jgi:flagellar basal body P-ring formation protein FlgA
MKAAARIGLALALVLGVPAAGRAERPSVPTTSAVAEVRALVEAGLPADLAIVSIDAPKDLDSRDIEVRWKGAPKVGRTRVLVLTGPEKARRSRWVVVELARKVRVTVATRALPVGAVLKDADLTVDDRPAKDALQLDPAALVGVRLRRPLAAGAALTESDVELGPPLARGTEVDVVIRSGAMAISARGRLESAARVGDTVRVRVEATRRILSGRLTGAGVVTVSSTTQLGAR